MNTNLWHNFRFARFLTSMTINNIMVAYSYLRKESPEQQIGCITGISSAMQNLALATGTLLSGVLVIQFRMREVYLVLALTMFLLAASMLMLLKQLISKIN